MNKAARAAGPNRAREQAVKSKGTGFRVRGTKQKHGAGLSGMLRNPQQRAKMGGA
jgi:hypothetical protein